MSDETARRPTVVGSILEGTIEDTLSRLDELPPACGLVEVRADRLPPAELPALVRRRRGRHLVVTLRRPEDGGAFDGSEELRRRTLLAALEAGAAYVDVELGSALEDLASGRLAPRVILSHHGVACRRDALRAVYEAMRGRGAGRLKIVPRCERPVEIAEIRRLLGEALRDGVSLACFASGRAGMTSRLFAPSWGSWGTYAAVEPGAETAEGQLTVRQMLEPYDVTGIGPDTRRFALIGSDLRASPSPAMHRAAYLAAGVDARYVPLECEQLDDVLPLLGPGGTLGIEAIGVTIPHKSTAHGRCRGLDPPSRASGAVNTVLLGEDGWSGFNTDAPAVLACVRRHLDPAGRQVAVIGAGGFARAAAAALTEAGADVTLYARDPGRVAASGASPAPTVRRLDGGIGDWDILVQATPLGREGESVVPAERLRGMLVLDAVYGAATPLVQEARRRGIAAVDGLEILVAQAELQFARMTGDMPASGVMQQAARLA